MAVRVSRLIRTGFHLRTKLQGGAAAKPLAADVAFNSMGTSPVLNSVDGGEGGILKVDCTTGTGTPAIANNNVVITFSQNPVAVWLRRVADAAEWHASISGATVLIGSKVAPVLSTNYVFELLVEF
jgi:hypothetical protein